MFLKLILIYVFHFTSISHGLQLDSSSLLKLVNITDFKLEGLGFLNVLPKRECKTANPLLPPLTDTCAKIVEKRNWKHRYFSSFPKFQKIYSNCKKQFIKNPTCFATCIFYGIITKEKYYASIFLHDIRFGKNLYFDMSTPFPHLPEYEMSTDENIFCFSKEYRPNLINNIVTCKLFSPTEFCIIDEDALHCDPHSGNCNFDESEASVISSGNFAHLISCGTLDTVKWKYFENSPKMQCIFPGRRKLQGTQRKVFKDCHVCSNKKDGKYGAVIEFPNVPTKEELSKVVYSVRPIVIRNGTQFEGIAPLNFSILKEIYQDFLVQDWEPCGYEMYGLKNPIYNFSYAFSKMNEEVEPYYLRWGICEPKIRERFGNLIKTRPSFLPHHFPTELPMPLVFAASPGEGSQCHYDYYRKTLMQVQLSGRKKWLLGAPPECNHLCKELLEVTVNQGDFILIQTNTWLHGVKIQDGDPSLAIGIEYELKEDFIQLATESDIKKPL